jgi:hypothetical protein
MKHSFWLVLPSSKKQYTTHAPACARARRPLSRKRTTTLKPACAREGKATDGLAEALLARQGCGSD